MWHSVKPLHWFVIAVVLAVPSAAVSQVQVNQIFVPQGPAPSAGDRIVVGSADNPPNGTVVGAIQAVVADPVDPNTFYVGSPNGGIWKTTDGGKAWTPLTDNQASLSIASLSLDPTDPTRKTLIAGTGLTSNGNIGSLNSFFVGLGGLQNGLLYSKDAGATWTSLGAGPLAGQSVIDVVARGNVMLAATFEPRAFSAGGRGQLEACFAAPMEAQPSRRWSQLLAYQPGQSPPSSATRQMPTDLLPL
jgi:hypothetical protein